MKKIEFKVNNEKHIVENAMLTGREILILAGKEPVENYRLYQKIIGQVEMEEIKLDDIIDLSNPGIEMFKTGKYRIKIDKTNYVVEVDQMTGKEILELAEKKPYTGYRLNQRLHGGTVQKVEYDQIVDFSNPGIEKFLTLPLDQIDGGSEIRKEFILPEDDIEFLNQNFTKWETINDSGHKWLIIYKFPICEGYNETAVNIALRIDSGYPISQIDMVYFYPLLQKVNNTIPISALSNQQIDNLNWQRWSRHRTPINPWRAGVDNVSTHISLINYWLEKELNK